MKRTCETCTTPYDDLYQFTICPHEAFAYRHGKKWECCDRPLDPFKYDRGLPITEDSLKESVNKSKKGHSR